MSGVIVTPFRIVLQSPHNHSSIRCSICTGDGTNAHMHTDRINKRGCRTACTLHMDDSVTKFGVFILQTPREALQRVSIGVPTF